MKEKKIFNIKNRDSCAKNEKNQTKRKLIGFGYLSKNHYVLIKVL